MSIFGTPVVAGVNVYPNPPANTGTFNTNVGDLIIGWCGSVFGSPGAVTCSDLAGNTFTALTQRGSGGSNVGRFFYCLAATNANASNYLTVNTGSGGVIAYAYAWNVSLTGGTAAYDFDTDFSALASSPSTSPTYSATGSDELIVSVVCDVSRGDSFTAGTGFTATADTGGSFPGGQRSEYQITSSPGSSAGWSWSSGSTCQIMALGFKAAAPPKPSGTIVVIMG